MGQADWADLGGSLSAASIARGVTAGIAPPAGASWVYGYNSLTDTAGAHGKYVDLPGFNPTGSGLSVPDGGGSVRGCVKRVASPGATGMSPFLFFCCQGGPPTVNDVAYLLGPSNADPYELCLAKGPIVGGIVPEQPDTTILARSSAQYSIGDGLWHHLRLDPIVQPNGDVLIQCFENDLALQPIGVAPDWQPILGFPAGGFVDDVLRIATGSAPLWGGWVGFGFASYGELNRRGGFAALEAYRAT
jgi:hypothetical protein